MVNLLNPSVPWVLATLPWPKYRGGSESMSSSSISWIMFMGIFLVRVNVLCPTSRFNSKKHDSNIQPAPIAHWISFMTIVFKLFSLLSCLNRRCVMPKIWIAHSYCAFCGASKGVSRSLERNSLKIRGNKFIKSGTSSALVRKLNFPISVRRPCFCNDFFRILEICCVEKHDSRIPIIKEQKELLCSNGISNSNSESKCRAYKRNRRSNSLQKFWSGCMTQLRTYKRNFKHLAFTKLCFLECAKDLRFLMNSLYFKLIAGLVLPPSNISTDSALSPSRPNCSLIVRKRRCLSASISLQIALKSCSFR